jgi:hypothetical protein
MPIIPPTWEAGARGLRISRPSSKTKNKKQNTNEKNGM